MKESVLHHIWKTKLLSTYELKTTNGQSLEIIETGLHNNNAGPDFLNAKIRLGETLWAGNVEIHVKSSDWFAHKHQFDKAYDNVILHIVYEDDMPESDFNLPTLELKEILPDSVFEKYKQYVLGSVYQFIPCENEFNSIDEFKREFFLESLVIQKIDNKAERILQILAKCKGDWEETAVQHLAFCFGLKINAESFELLFESIPFQVIKKIRNKPLSFYALLIGQADLWSRLIDNESKLELQSEYKFLRTKFQLTPLSHTIFKYSRLRPSSFPHNRLKQLADFVGETPSLFTWAISDTKSLFPDKKPFTDFFIKNLIINFINPLQLAYKKNIGKDATEQILHNLSELKAEKNTIIKKYTDLGFKVKNAKQSQGLLELNKNYCKKLKCLNCSIGNEILKYNG